MNDHMHTFIFHNNPINSIALAAVVYKECEIIRVIIQGYYKGLQCTLLNL